VGHYRDHVLARSHCDLSRTQRLVELLRCSQRKLDSRLRKGRIHELRYSIELVGRHSVTGLCNDIRDCGVKYAVLEEHAPEIVPGVPALPTMRFGNRFRSVVITELTGERQLANVSIQVVDHVAVRRLARRKVMSARSTDENFDDPVGVVVDELVKLFRYHPIELEVLRD
jgi:hypothetical protein